MTTRKGTKKPATSKTPARKVAARAKAQDTEARIDAKLDPRNNDAKIDDLQKNTEESAGEFLTTNHGVRINDNQN